jgi:hypothetical protein
MHCLRRFDHPYTLEPLVLKWRKGQLKSSKDHVQRRDDRELQESGVVRFLEVVRVGRRDADEYHGSNRH